MVHCAFCESEILNSDRMEDDGCTLCDECYDMLETQEEEIYLERENIPD